MLSTKKIEELTKDQIAKFPIYVDKWLKIGLATNRITLETAKPIIDNLYKKILNKPTVPIIILRSPLEAWIGTLCIACLFNSEEQVLNQVMDQVRDQLLKQVETQVCNQVWDQVGDQIETQVSNQVWNKVNKQVLNQDSNFVWPYLSGKFSVGYFAFYDFLIKELKLKNISHLWDHFIKTSELNLIYPLDQVCILSDNPVEIHIVNGLLHKDGSPAIKYSDGFSVWSLNGVKVSKEIAETPAEKLEAKLILKEKNAEVRREIVRKIGVERVCKDLEAKVMDSYAAYELLSLDLGDGRNRPYLKMKNPSIGTYHIEGVHPNCKTVKEALNWRNQSEEIPFSLT